MNTLVSAQHILEVQKVSKAFSGKKILANISLTLSQGEIILLSGKNGVGKSTLLKILAGMQSADSGSFRFQPASLKEQIGYLGHSLMMYEELTLRENFRLFFALRSVEIPSDKLSLWNLSELLDLPLRKLSQGQAAKANIFRALYAGSRILFFDEPSAALDVSATELFCRELKAQIDSAACFGAILVSHDLERLRVLSGREVQLVNGNLFEAWEVRSVPEAAVDGGL